MNEPYSIRVLTFGKVEVTRKSAMMYHDNRYMFRLGPEEKAAECADPLPDNFIVKGHAVSQDGNYDVLIDDCTFCKRSKGSYVRSGREVAAWLDQMPSACRRYWQERGCNGDGHIIIGGDDVQGYSLECAGCEKCQPVSQPIPFQTTPEQLTSLHGITLEMNAQGLTEEFILAATKFAQTDQGIFDLMSLWFHSTDEKERDEIIDDLEKSINDYLSA